MNLKGRVWGVWRSFQRCSPGPLECLTPTSLVVGFYSKRRLLAIYLCSFTHGWLKKRLSSGKDEFFFVLVSFTIIWFKIIFLSPSLVFGLFLLGKIYSKEKPCTRHYFWTSVTRAITVDGTCEAAQKQQFNCVYSLGNLKLIRSPSINFLSRMHLHIESFMWDIKEIKVSYTNVFKQCVELYTGVRSCFSPSFVKLYLNHIVRIWLLNHLYNSVEYDKRVW